MIDGILKLGHFDDFDADRLIVPIAFTFVNSARVSFADMFVDGVGITLYSFHVIIVKY